MTDLLLAARARLTERLTEHQLEMLIPLLPNLARLQCVLQADDAGSAGRIGGTMSLPPGFAWPRAKDGRPMIGWLQVDLARLDDGVGLPTKGTLVAFLARASRPGPPTELDCDSGWLTVLDAETARVPTDPPSGAPTLPQCSLGAELHVSLPSASSVHLHARIAELAQREEDLWAREHELDDDELPPETPFEERFHGLLDTLAPPGPALAWLGGHSLPCQADPLPDASWDVVLQGRASRPHGYDIMTGGMVYAMVPHDGSGTSGFEDARWAGQR